MTVLYIHVLSGTKNTLSCDLNMRCFFCCLLGNGHDYMGVSKNSGTPKWMAIMDNPIKMDDLGYHHFRKHPYEFDYTTHSIHQPNVGQE